GAWGGLQARSDMPKWDISTAKGLLIALAIALGLLLGVDGPSSAQFFNFGGYPQRPEQRGGGWFGGGWFGNGTFGPFQRRAPPPRRARSPAHEDYSKAPPTEKRSNVPSRHILVLGDGMADWLAYGLEDAYSEQPDIGVTRKVKNASGLIKYQPKGDPSDWA